MQKRLKNILHVGIVISLLTCDALAYENNFQYSLAFVGMGMDYKEYNPNGVLLDSETSSLGEITGYEMGLDYILDSDRYTSDEIGIDLMVLDGKSAYKGSLLGSGNPYGSYVSTTQNSFIDTSIKYKHTDIYEGMLHFSYGLGLGYYAWNRKLSSSQEELYSWFSLRPMLGLSVDIDQFNVGITAEYQYGFNTKMHSSNPALDFTLGSADIFELTLPFIYNYNHETEFFIKTVFSKQTIGKSDNVSDGSHTYYEPDSTSYSSYVKAGIAFKF
ncbi:hypothetical protein KKA17_05385 [bacterium]|nr:hypothetical protein [bacterium]MBU1884099.1 hypothetical protein [bacterium]